MIGAGDIACTASPCPATIQRFMHRGKHITMLPHAKIIIGTPDSNLTPHTLVMPNSAGEFTAAAFKIGENAVPPFPAEAIKLCLEEFFVIHVKLSLPRISIQVLPLNEASPWRLLPKCLPPPCR
jgi:hypothetical protein